MFFKTRNDILLLSLGTMPESCTSSPYYFSEKGSATAVIAQWQHY